MILYYDQMNVITKHLRMAYSTATHSANNINRINFKKRHKCSTPPKIRKITDHCINESELGQFFKLNQLKKILDWPEWQNVCYKMLDIYHKQGMFSEPMEEPHNANIHHMLWKYLTKMCGTRKA
jgi:hypothetical protein